MGSFTKQTISAQIPVDMLVERERRHQRIQAGLVDVDAGRVVSHSDMVDFANRLKKSDPVNNSV